MNMALDKPLAPSTFFLVLAKKLQKNNYLLQDQNYEIQLIFKLKINNGIHLRNNTFSSYLTLTEILQANCNCSCCNYAITCIV